MNFSEIFKDQLQNTTDKPLIYIQRNIDGGIIALSEPDRVGFSDISTKNYEFSEKYLGDSPIFFVVEHD